MRIWKTWRKEYNRLNASKGEKFAQKWLKERLEDSEPAQREGRCPKRDLPRKEILEAIGLLVQMEESVTASSIQGLCPWYAKLTVRSYLRAMIREGLIAKTKHGYVDDPWWFPPEGK